jgi:hypothetical protein
MTCHHTSLTYESWSTMEYSFNAQVQQVAAVPCCYIVSATAYQPAKRHSVPTMCVDFCTFVSRPTHRACIVGFKATIGSIVEKTNVEKINIVSGDTDIPKDNENETLTLEHLVTSPEHHQRHPFSSTCLCILRQIASHIFPSDIRLIIVRERRRRVSTTLATTVSTYDSLLCEISRSVVNPLSHFGLSDATTCETRACLLQLLTACRHLPTDVTIISILPHVFGICTEETFQLAINTFSMSINY